MKSEVFGRGELIKIGVLFLLPIAHPMLLPFVGTPSHLLWWVHVLPVARLSFRLGPRTAMVSLALSATLVSVGEWLFGLGYGVPADRETILALAVALSATNALVASFALHARRVTARYRLLFDRLQMGVMRGRRDREREPRSDADPPLRGSSGTPRHGAD